jgi:peptidoglycan/LPS O-acetylase OafA/YrhL
MILVLVGTVGVCAIYAIDVITSVDGGTRAGLRIAALVGAVLVAGVVYQRWGALPERTPADHAMAGAGLIGGALVASSTFAAGSAVFANAVTGALGCVAMLVALVAARTTVSPTKDPR